MSLTVQYRGSLSSCNYSCNYCPFAKRKDTRAQLSRDCAALRRFTSWLGQQSDHRWKVLFTPWGEALVRRWYPEAIVELTHLKHVETVAVQTNLSCHLNWVDDCRTDRLALWATYHPTETKAERFVAKVCGLRAGGVRLSVGMVGVPEFIDEIKMVRRLLPEDVYLWINAQQPRSRRYTSKEIEELSVIDPQFSLTARRGRSFGRKCGAGEVTFTVDHAGDMRCCHFVDEVLGNIYEHDWEQALRLRLCPNRFCDCFLGKAQLQADLLAPFFGTSILERVPARFVRSTHPIPRGK